jgi:UDP-2-acetamido-2-deoxy-ribo-hexuluronate aminotransferase
MISLFQNSSNWRTIREQVWHLVEKDHAQGLAQNSQLTKKLEQRLAQQFGRKHCVTTASCTDALFLSVKSLNLPPQSRVAVSSYTFTATAHAVARAGHQVVPIDVGNDYCIDVGKISDCAAVVAVDIFGNMSHWESLNQLGIPLISDAAQSLESRNGTCWSAKNGVVGCVSFAPSKPISSWGSGGAVLTDNDAVAESCRLLRLHGKNCNSDHAIDPGLNSMISSFEAACIWSGLDHSDTWQTRRNKIAQYLIERSKYQSGMQQHLQQHTYSKLVFQSDLRDQTVVELRNAGIECAVHYQLPVHRESLYPGVATNSDRLSKISFSVPNQHTLTDAEVEHIGKILQ